MPSYLAVTQVPMPFVVQKVGTSSLPLASSSCPPELHLEALPAAAQGATCTDAATSYLLFKNRHLPIQQLLYSRIKTISMLLLFSQCFCIVVTCLTCLCSVCNLSLTAHMDTCSLNTFQWLPSAINSQACCSCLRMSPG